MWVKVVKGVVREGEEGKGEDEEGKALPNGLATLRSSLLLWN